MGPQKRTTTDYATTLTPVMVEEPAQLRDLATWKPEKVTKYVTTGKTILNGSLISTVIKPHS
jgi:hypothetical protein